MVYRRYDYYSYIVGNHFPLYLQGYYFGIHAFYLEIIRAREISSSLSVCQNRLLWWEDNLLQIEKVVNYRDIYIGKDPSRACFHLPKGNY